MTAISTFALPDDTNEPDLLALVMRALEAKGRIPKRRPTSSAPAYFNRDNIDEFYIEKKAGGWVGNIAFKNVPPGCPDVMGTPDATPYETPREAFMRGAAILCLIVTGSSELPFFEAGDQLICVAY
jgi:hypothetical protein